MKIAIVGCGYAGRVLARRMIERGNPVRATTTTETNLSQLAALGAEPIVLRADQKDQLARTVENADAVVYLAPPSKEQSAGDFAATIARACPSGLRALVYGSSTGVYGKQEDPEGWVDESTPPRDPHQKGKERLLVEQALAKTGLPLKVVRIAGIYGPGRTMSEAIKKQQLLVFEGGPKTSRIHVEDLSRILEAMCSPTAPPLVLACDNEPAETLEVARYTCQLIGVTAPDPVPIEDARRLMSPLAMELRFGGHRCRSLVRDKLIGKLEYPTYREGIRASLRAEGVQIDG